MSAPPARLSRRRLYVGSWATDFSLMLVIFAVSRGLAEQGASLGTLGWFGGAYSLCWAVSSFACGHAADRWSRRGLVMAGAVTAAVSAGGLLLCRGQGPWMPIFYGLNAVSGGVIYPPIIAWLTAGDGTRRRKRTEVSRAIITFCLAWNTGLICGQYGGGVLFAVDPRWPLALAVGLSALTFCLFVRAVEPDLATMDEEVRDEADTEAEQRLSSAFAWVSWIANLGSSFCVGLVMHLFPHLAVSLGVPSDDHGFLLAAMRVVIIGAYFLMFSFTFWHHRFVVHLVVQVVAFAGLLQLSRAVSEAGLLLGLSALGCLLGFNYFASLYYSTTGSHDRKKGLVSGINEAIIGLGLGAGAIVGGLWGMHAGPRAPYELGAAVLVVSAVVQTILVNTRVARVRRGAENRDHGYRFKISEE